MSHSNSESVSVSNSENDEDNLPEEPQIVLENPDLPIIEAQWEDIDIQNQISERDDHGNRGIQMILCENTA